MATSIYAFPSGKTAQVDKLTAADWNALMASLEQFFVQCGELFQEGCFLSTDFNASIVAGQLSASMSAGTAVVGGTDARKIVQNTGAVTCTGLDASATNYIWLKQDGTFFGDSNLANQPANSLLVATVVTDGTEVTTVNNLPTGRKNLAQLIAARDLDNSTLEWASSTARVKDAGITAAKLAAAVQDAVPNVNITVGAEAANVIAATVQFRDIANNNLASRCAFTAWLSDSANAVPTSSAPDGGWAAGASGYKIKDHTTNIVGEWATDASGTTIINITHAAGAKTLYLHVHFDGIVYVSGAITFA
jgi:hypothetical protein